MLDQMWKALIGYLEKQPFWGILQPVLLIVFLYVGAAIVVYQYVQWQYGLSPAPDLYVRSFLFKQVTVVFIVVVAVIAAFRLRRPADEDAGSGVRAWMVRHRPWLARRGLVAVTVLLLGLLLFMSVTPSGAAANVLLMFDAPGRSPRSLGFDPYRLTYLVYELNREQRA